MFLKLLKMALLLVGLIIGMSGGGQEEPVQFSLEVSDIEVKALLQLLAKHAGKNLVLSDQISGKMSLSLHQVPWREALDTILQARGLSKYESEHVITIVTPGELSQNEGTLLQTKVFNLNYVSAEQLAKSLPAAGVLSSQGKSAAETSSNRLMVADTREKLDRVDALLRQVDQPTKQVLIEARIVSADSSFMRELGVELRGRHITTGSTHAKAAATAVADQGHFNVTIAKLDSSEALDLQLIALENQGRGRVISKPRLLATDRQVASIETGSEIPYQERTKEGNTSVAFKKAVLSLKVTPEVVSPQAVNLTLELNQDKIGQLLVNGVPTIDTRKIQTQVLVQNRETIVLGGIYEWSKVNQVSKVPVLGDIPLLNLIFSRRTTQWERKELLIFVTPQILSHSAPDPLRHHAPFH